ncbi:ISL3 family transposase [Allorhizocola rhizosphaerae]|uniref:ISL3 family transposase n=1 Tax=Allorhizocola rhizosphaerae TaxID=1872709 RepID=UPI001FE421A6|nr:ISL3 family transposase [Allorhizocola rhizosphaerae]
MLLPHLAGVEVQRVELGGGSLRIWAKARDVPAVCPRCERRSARVHSRYERRLVDAAIGGRQVEIRISVRRLFCRNKLCPAVTFAEQIDGLTARHARRSPALRQMLESIGLALAGRAGARLAIRLGLPATRSSMLRLIRAMPEPTVDQVKVLGVDDFALRRGHVYGTVLVDMDTHRPVDLLPDRQAATFAAWLQAHPGTEVVCRDRAGAYADAANSGAPQAVQVADRWHLWHNLGEHVENAVIRHHRCIREHAQAQLAEPAAARAEQIRATEPAVPREGKYASRARGHYQQIHDLLAKGMGIKAISRHLGLARGTVRRFARAAQPEDLLAKAWGRGQGRPSIIDPYADFLHQRLAEGPLTTTQLFKELKALGYTGTYDTLRQYVKPLRELHPARRGPVVPKARRIAGWLLRHPDTLDAEEQLQLKQVRAACPHLDRLALHINDFAQILTQLQGQRLNEWISAAEADDDLSELRSFAAGIKRDHAAVINGLTLPYSSGGVCQVSGGRFLRWLCLMWSVVDISGGRR